MENNGIVLRFKIKIIFSNIFENGKEARKAKGVKKNIIKKTFVLKILESVY
jgi:hypothetical protein